MSENDVNHLADKSREKSRQAALSAYESWDKSWPEILRQIESRGQNIQCQKGCTHCCYTRKFCTLSEGIAILDFVQKGFSPEKQEHFRLRTESSVSSLKKFQADGFCETEEVFCKAGGLECPFLDAGECAIHEVRPLDCRALNVVTGVQTEKCRQSPRSVNAIQSEIKRAALQKDLTDRESEIQASPFLHPRANLAEVMSLLWEREPSPSYLFTRKAWEDRKRSRAGSRDENWQDDRSDIQVMRRPVSLPDEGDYPEGLTLVTQHLEVHELYDRQVSGSGMPDFFTLYKRQPGCTFDWNQRRFQWDKSVLSELAYTVWMSDGLQERLMMWEAAKRVRGRVLCGGLGLGIFPQMAFSLPSIDSMDIIEWDSSVIQLIQAAWERHPWPGSSKCKIIQSTIEEYLRTTDQKYDTVYLDTWDAIYHEYLPHLNELSSLSERILEPEGEVLLWAYDLMVRAFLKAARLILDRRESYLATNSQQLANISKNYPLLHELVSWLKRNPSCSSEDLLTEAHRIATQERRDLGPLVLSRQPGAQHLLDLKYFRES